MISASSQRRIRLALVMLLLAAFALQLVAMFSTTSVAKASAPSQTSTIPNTDLDPYGVNTFLDKEVEYWKKERTMQMINQAGIKSIKQLFAWNEIEFKKGYFYDDKNKKSSWQKYDEIVDLASKYGIRVVARIDQTPAWANPAGNKPNGRPANFQDYADFLKAFVQHYKGKVQYIQVWNEPNLEREWIPGQPVQPTQYVDMLKTAYTSIKAADPAVKVMAAPLAITLEETVNLSELTYLDRMYKAGAKKYFDIMPANAYGLEHTPEDAPDPSKLNFRRVELLHNVMVKNDDASKAVWFNEFGWNASPLSIPKDKLTWGRVTEQQQAQYTVDAINYAKKNWPWFGVAFIWYFRQVGDIPDTASEQYFQLVTKDFQPKPVYTEVKKAALAYLVQQGQPTPVPVTPPVPATSTPVPSGSVTSGAAATTAASTDTTAGATTGATVAATTSATTASVTATVASTTPAATPTPAGTAGANNSSSGDNSSIIFVIIGAILVLGAGGGLAYWLSQQRRT
ncbi:MAG TPA: cellulase family glycosylhydrolase [Chloroflexia bacterium]|nr:cellulase family glycosylhydrolase [Chloroflexia bacterium]